MRILFALFIAAAFAIALTITSAPPTDAAIGCPTPAFPEQVVCLGTGQRWTPAPTLSPALQPSPTLAPSRTPGPTRVIAPSPTPEPTPTATLPPRLPRCEG